MLGRHAGFPAALLALLAALTVAVGLTACGDSDDDSNGSGSANAAQGDSTSTAASGEEKAVGDAMRDLRTAFNDKDGAAYCDLLSAQGKKEMTGYAATLPVLKTRNCSKFMTKYSTRLVEHGGVHRPVRVRKVTVDGNNAKIVMQGGMAGIRSIATFKLVKENGQWKLADPVTGTATRRLPAKYL